MNLADMKAQYDRDGFYYPIDVMSREQAASYRAELEGIEAAIKDDKDKRRALRRHWSGYPTAICTSCRCSVTTPGRRPCSRWTAAREC